MRPFIGVDDLEAILGVSVDENALITTIALDSGCQAVRSFLDQTINFVPNDVETIDGHGTKKIRLHERPVRKLTQVTLDGQVVDPSLYNLKKSTIRRVDIDRWPVGYANIQATYDHGYDVIPDSSSGDDVLVPPDMRLVALLSSRRVYVAVGKVDGVQGVKQSESIGQYSYTLSAGASAAATSAAQLVDAEKDVLLHYRIGVVPAR
jgi:hypothetical protein